MGIAGFLVRSFREAPSKRRLLRGLALGSKGGDRTLTSADGTRLSVRATGNGPPLVLVHGTLDGIGAFSTVELELAERYEVWVYDRRGRGGSGDAAEYALDREVADLRTVIEATGSIPHVLGHSYGGVIALRARLAGVAMRSLVVYEPPLHGSVLSTDTIEAIRRTVEADRRDEAIRMMAGGLAGLSDDELSIALSVPPVRKRLRDGVRTAPRELEAIRDCRWDDLPVTGAPTLVLLGERTTAPVYPTADQARDLAEDVETATLPGQGHVAQVFTPSAFATTVLDFLDRH